MINKNCFCGSKKRFAKCCKEYCEILNINKDFITSETTLIDWLEKYSQPIANTFIKKAKVYVFRISFYLDVIIDNYFNLNFKLNNNKNTDIEKMVFSIKNQILNSILGSISCLSQMLFIQSGILLRSAIEDTLVLLDINEDQKQLSKLIKSNYSATGIITRIKNLIPKNVINWYGYFSANFTHFGPYHSAPVFPAKCYPDNFILVCGLQNIVRAIVTFHIILERIYYDKISSHYFWKFDIENSDLLFNENSSVFTWTEKLGKEITITFPPNERKKGFIYNSKNYKSK